jgi:sigma-E factor negative regulatory protein RseB
MRQLAAVLSVLALGAGLPAAADPGLDPMSWLQRAAASSRQGTYSGTVMHMQGDRTSTSRITHVIVAGIEHERMESLDGPRREVVRRGDELQCFYPDAKTVRIDRRLTARFFPSLFSGPVEAIAEGYHLSLGQVERVAGMDCQWIHLDPKDALRYAQRLCAEIGTGLLLRAKTLGPRDRVLEQYAFIDVRLGGDVSKRELRSTFKEQSKDWRRDEQPAADPAAATTGWAVAALPPGFRVVGEMQRNMPNRPQPVTQLALSDGFAAMSVFIEPVTGRPPSGEATSVDGLLSVFARPMGEYLVTVLGEVPPAAAQQVGRSVGRAAGR